MHHDVAGEERRERHPPGAQPARQEILELFRFIDWLLRLPDELAHHLALAALAVAVSVACADRPAEARPVDGQPGQWVVSFKDLSGTFVNAEGRVQSFHGVVKPRGDARPAWKVLRVLGNLLGLPGFAHETSEEVPE